MSPNTTRQSSISSPPVSTHHDDVMPTFEAANDTFEATTFMPEQSQMQRLEEEKKNHQERDQEMKKFLLHQIEEHPCIWKLSHPLFKEKSGAQKYAWESVLRIMKETYEDDLVQHSLSTVQDLMAAWSSLKAGLRQAEKSSKKTTGMAASSVKPITWPFYHSIAFYRSNSEPLSTQSSLEGVELDDTTESSSTSSKWDPKEVKRKRGEKRKAIYQKQEERQSAHHEGVMSTLEAARDTLKSVKKDRKRKKKDKECEEDDDEGPAFLKYLGTQIRQVMDYNQSLFRV